ncbi:MAG: RdgB/HAM1 family non-canonical purine NTP pyrophosphatase [Desulfovibrio sp.]|nr:RdgB/HAM1 family non-canonical purine NTP pyrophosphatase [Desulfovibrio sp.]
MHDITLPVALRARQAEHEASVPENPGLSVSPRESIVLATRNRGKIGELAVLLRPFGLEVLGMGAFPEIGEIEENGSSFAENALLKARTVAAATGFVALADDSGLETDALAGAPGIFSARYAVAAHEAASDRRNIEKLLQDMHGVAAEKRGACFRCCMAARAPGGEEILAEGAWEGRITQAPAGGNGFGYDPVFFDPELGCTAAQMSGEEKNRRSHRAAAAARLLKLWPEFWEKWLNNRG